jgi:putative membrane protein
MVVWELHIYRRFSHPIQGGMVMVQVKKISAALGAVVALCAGGIASAQEVALAQDAPESKFLMDAVRGNLAEVKLGELAEQKGQSEGVREFGTMLVEDHSKALKETAELAKDLNVIPPALPSAEQTQKHDAMARLSGAEFDREFAAEMVKDHQEDIAKYEQQAKSGDSKVAKLAEDALPTLREHLAAAQRLQSGGDVSHDRPHN